jgi:hypothetical protein
MIKPVTFVGAEAAVDLGGHDRLPFLGRRVAAGRDLLHVFGHNDVVGQPEITHVGQLFLQWILRGTGRKDAHGTHKSQP